jgi:hypothetical protein
MIAPLLLAPLLLVSQAGDGLERWPIVLRGGDAPLVLLEQEGRRGTTRRVEIASAEDLGEVVACRQAVFRARLEPRTDTREHGLTVVYPVRRPDPPRRPRCPGAGPSFDQCSPPGRVRCFLQIAHGTANLKRIVPVTRGRAEFAAASPRDALLAGAVSADEAGQTVFELVALGPEALAALSRGLSAGQRAKLRAARFRGWRFDPAGIHLTLVADGLELRLAIQG